MSGPIEATTRDERLAAARTVTQLRAVALIHRAVRDGRMVVTFDDVGTRAATVGARRPGALSMMTGGAIGTFLGAGANSLVGHYDLTNLFSTGTVVVGGPGSWRTEACTAMPPQRSIASTANSPNSKANSKNVSPAGNCWKRAVTARSDVTLYI